MCKGVVRANGRFSFGLQDVTLLNPEHPVYGVIPRILMRSRQKNVGLKSDLGRENLNILIIQLAPAL